MHITIVLMDTWLHLDLLYGIKFEIVRADRAVSVCLFVNRPPGSHPLNPDAPGFSGYVVHLGQVGGMP